MGIENFNEENCQLFTPIDIFMGIFNLSGGKPCEGCSYASNCQNYYMLNPHALRPSRPADRIPRPNKKRPKNKSRAAF